MDVHTINVEGLARLPEFSHASVVDGWVYVAGTLGTVPETMALADGGTGPQTAQTLANIQRILDAAGSSLDRVVKVNVYLTDLADFDEMNDAYRQVFADHRPARITVGVAALALGASVEIDCTAIRETDPSISAAQSANR